jgi:hypothetical protein
VSSAWNWSFSMYQRRLPSVKGWRVARSTISFS